MLHFLILKPKKNTSKQKSLCFILKIFFWYFLKQDLCKHTFVIVHSCLTVSFSKSTRLCVFANTNTLKHVKHLAVRLRRIKASAEWLRAKLPLSLLQHYSMGMHVRMRACVFNVSLSCSPHARGETVHVRETAGCSRAEGSSFVWQERSFLFFFWPAGRITQAPKLPWCQSARMKTSGSDNALPQVDFKAANYAKEVPRQRS